MNLTILAVLMQKIDGNGIVKYLFHEIKKIWGIISTNIAEFQRKRNFFMSSINMDPKELFLIQCNGLELYRPGITIRYLAVKDIVNGKNEDSKGLELYKKFCTIGGGDPNIYVDKLTSLVNSFASQGYNSDYYLLCDNKMALLDGHHRLTCALFFEDKSVCVRNLITSLGDGGKLSEWGPINTGLSDEEIDFIRNESDLLVECTINSYIKENKTIFDPTALREWIFKESKKIYGFEYYQSFPMLGINGNRQTDLRIEQYGLKELLNKKMDVLDIGCHIGFMDMEIASLVRNVTGIEIYKPVSQLSKSIARKLNIYNATFICADFKEWESISRRKYDLILSFANYRWLGLNPQEYVTKIDSLIKHGGYVFFEGHDIMSFSDEQKEYGDYIDAFINFGFSRIKSGYSNDQESVKRIWTLLQHNVET